LFVDRRAAGPSRRLLGAENSVNDQQQQSGSGGSAKLRKQKHRQNQIKLWKAEKNPMLCEYRKTKALHELACGVIGRRSLFLSAAQLYLSCMTPDIRGMRQQRTPTGTPCETTGR